MSPLKKGSKLTDKPKDTMLRVRLDKEMVERLDYVSETLGISKSEVVRKGIQEQYENIKNRSFATLRKCLRNSNPKQRYVNIIALHTSVWQ